jgi:hypothetical protein
VNVGSADCSTNLRNNTCLAVPRLDPQRGAAARLRFVEQPKRSPLVRDEPHPDVRGDNTPKGARFRYIRRADPHAAQRKRRCLSRSAAQVSLSIVGSKPLPCGRVDMTFGAGSIVTSHRLCLARAPTLTLQDGWLGRSSRHHEPPLHLTKVTRTL